MDKRDAEGYRFGFPFTSFFSGGALAGETRWRVACSNA